MASLTVLSSSTSTSTNSYLLTTGTTSTTTVTKIAPKRSSTDSSSSRSRRNSSRPSSPPSGAARGPSVARRNERERNRVRQVNMGFSTLRQHVPNRSKKMSKVETLRSAVQYIRQLQTLLGTDTGPMSAADLGDDSCGGTDENCSGGVPGFSEAFARQSQYTNSGGSAQPSSAGAGSPAPSLGSDASSPYDSLSPEDELIDFTTWLS